MFFGAQILCKKTGIFFGGLPPAGKQELREYVFTLLVKLCDDHVTSKPVIAKLA
jgi:hypothetical protein